jgi:hypothetical protein
MHVSLFKTRNTLLLPFYWRKMPVFDTSLNISPWDGVSLLYIATWFLVRLNIILASTRHSNTNNNMNKRITNLKIICKKNTFKLINTKSLNAHTMHEAFEIRSGVSNPGQMFQYSTHLKLTKDEKPKGSILGSHGLWKTHMQGSRYCSSLTKIKLVPVLANLKHLLTVIVTLANWLLNL